MEKEPRRLSQKDVLRVVLAIGLVAQVLSCEALNLFGAKKAARPTLALPSQCIGGSEVYGHDDSLIYVKHLGFIATGIDAAISNRRLFSFPLWGHTFSAHISRPEYWDNFGKYATYPEGQWRDLSSLDGHVSVTIDGRTYSLPISDDEALHVCGADTDNDNVVDTYMVK